MISTRKLIAGLAILFLILSCSIYTVDQRYIAIEKVLGNIQTNGKGEIAVMQPGLHVKYPLLTSIIVFDTRLQTLTSQQEKIPTENQKFVYVDYFVKWRIADVMKYYLATMNDNMRLSALLEPMVSDALKAEFGQKELVEVVSADRAIVMNNVRDTLVKKTENLGISVVDMRIKKIELPEKVSDSVFQNMRADRVKVANEHRAQGKKMAETIQAQADATVVETLASADRTAREIKGKADAQAARIYAEAYDQDIEFFRFSRSLQAYAKIFKNKQHALVLSSDADFFKYLKHEARH